MPQPDLLQQLQAQIAAWKARLEQLQAEKKEAYAEEIAQLQAKLAEAQRRYPEIRKARDEAVQDLAGGVKSAWGELLKAADTAKKRFR